MGKRQHKHLDYDSYKRDYDAFVKEQKKKKRAPIMKVVIPLIVVILLVGAGVVGYYVASHPDALESLLPKQAAPEAETPEAEPQEDEVPAEADTDSVPAQDPHDQDGEDPEVEPLEPLTLTTGEYVAGVDFPAGRYVLTTEEEKCEFAKPGQNWTLRRGDDGYTCTFDASDRLTCGGVITLTPVDGYNQPMVEDDDDAENETAGPVEVQDDGVIKLSAGDYIAGEDFSAGRYIITSESELCIFTAEDEDGDGIFTVLSPDDGSYTGTLEKGYKVHCSDPVTLTPYNP